VLMVVVPATAVSTKDVMDVLNTFPQVP